MATLQPCHLDPETRHQVLIAFLGRDTSLRDISQEFSLKVPDLLAWFNDPKTQEILAQIAAMAEVRERLLLAHSRHVAIGVLEQAMGYLADQPREARRAASAILRAAPFPASRATPDPTTPDPPPHDPAPPAPHPAEAAPPPAPAQNPEPSPQPPGRAVTSSPRADPIPHARADLSPAPHHERPEHHPISALSQHEPQPPRHVRLE